MIGTHATGSPMKFARIVFLLAGVWGILVLTPFYWLLDITGRRYAPPMEYPGFFWGFMAITMTFQLVFLMIGSDPRRFRPLMIPCMLEKFGYVATLLLLFNRGRIPWIDTQPFIPDLTLGLLFVAAYVKTRGA